MWDLEKFTAFLYITSMLSIILRFIMGFSKVDTDAGVKCAS